jgi:23S rRNA (guanosine2251-2'-O)-methyltransferase
MKTPPPRSRPSRPRRGPGPRGRDREPTDWILGTHGVQEALRAGRRRLDRLLLQEKTRSRAEEEGWLALAREAGVAVEWVDEAVLDRIAGSEVRTQGVALAAGPLPELDLDALLEQAAERVARAPALGGRRIVLLDGVEDPQNVGAIARVAEASGCCGLVLTDRRAPPLSAAVSRASAGAIEWLPVARVTNLGRAIERLKQAGFWVLAAALEGGRSIYALPDRVLTGELALVLGAEGPGVRPSILAQADHRVWIPMRGEVESLNVSTAGAVILYELLRRADPAHDRPAGTGR